MNWLGTPASDAQPGVERYLAEVAARLPGSPRAHRDIVAELRSGILDATDAHCCAGLPPAEAVQAAIDEFGDPARVTDGFRAEIATGLARRAAVVVLVTRPFSWPPRRERSPPGRPPQRQRRASPG